MNDYEGATTTKGDKLALRLSRHIGTTYAIRVRCARICRAATTYNRYQEDWCSVEMTEPQERRRAEAEDRLEARIRDLVQGLPEADAGAFRVEFAGDPRGPVVRLVAPDGSEFCAEMP